MRNDLFPKTGKKALRTLVSDFLSMRKKVRSFGQTNHFEVVKILIHFFFQKTSTNFLCKNMFTNVFENDSFMGEMYFQKDNFFSIKK